MMADKCPHIIEEKKPAILFGEYTVYHCSVMNIEDKIKNHGDECIFWKDLKNYPFCAIHERHKFMNDKKRGDVIE